MNEVLKIEKKTKSLWVSLNRPEAHNALNKQLARALISFFTSTKATMTHRSIVISSTSPESFCSGADIHFLTTAPANDEGLGLIWDVFSSIRNCSVPVIARINGLTVGGGIGIIASCDMAFSATSKAKFGLPEAKKGLVPALVSSFVLPKIGSKKQSGKMCLTGERITGKEAERIGLTNEHFETIKQMDNEIERVCENIASCSPRSVSVSKRILNSQKLMTKQEAIQELDKARRSKDGSEGIKAFFEKRKPIWHFDEI